jgi:FixJ family two-component response regulator
MIKVLLDDEERTPKKRVLLDQLGSIISDIKSTYATIDLLISQSSRASPNPEILSDTNTKYETGLDKNNYHLIDSTQSAIENDSVALDKKSHTENFIISIIDDDDIVRSCTREMLEKLGWQVDEYSSAELLLESGNFNKNGCLLIDERLPNLRGNDLISNLRKLGCKSPCIMITGAGNIQLAVDAMKAGANDFLEKPLNISVLHRKLCEYRKLNNEYASNSNNLKLINLKNYKLSPREKEILEQMLQGHSNKIIAINLRISHRTVENHRSSIMKKTNSRSLMDLVRNAFIGPTS